MKSVSIIIGQNTKVLKVTGLILVVLVFFWFIPLPHFFDSYSTVLEDGKKQLLGAIIAEDSQWRFPPSDSVPVKFEKCIIAFEDKNFKSHVGIDLVAIGRAMLQNIKAKRVVSGGSTITMQLVRLSRKGKSRNIFEKLIEAIIAVKTDLVCSKSEILKQYVSHAPFGGNVVGLSAASWRYFGRDESKLSWAECALLAVLPNHPAMIHLARNRDLLQKKRDRLLSKLYKENIIDSTTYKLALMEKLPIEPQPMPQIAPHLLQRAVIDGKKGTIIQSSLDLALQRKSKDILNRYHTFLRANSIHNGAILILDVESGKVLAYIGNTENAKSEHENDVDIINAPRSYGSLLKPILYASMLEDGLLTPEMLIPDVPTNINGYSPQNFSKTFEGSVSAAKVLAHSLNVPSVRMLQNYGTEKFLFNLKQLNMNYLNKSADHYGLSIILGGGEASLWQLASTYGNMARLLSNKDPLQFVYDTNDSISSSKYKGNFPFSKASLWCTAEAIAESNRPGANGNWEFFNSSQKIAWKTGTSYGFRDAWSIGFTKKYVVGVWLGNANGEGRAGLTGIGTAAPLMLEILNFLDDAAWFTLPTNEMALVKICAKSGHKASNLCNETFEKYIPKSSLKTPNCPYHVKILLDKTGQYQVNSDCEKVSNMLIVSRFVLPPIQEWYYKSKDPTYISLPPFRADCRKIGDKIKVMEIIYPRRNAKIYIPKDLSGKRSKIVFEAAHRKSEISLFWHLDQQYLGETHKYHQMESFASEGTHILSIIDANGEVETVKFEIVDH